MEDSANLAGDDLTVLDGAWFIQTHRLVGFGYPFAELHPNILAWYKGLTKRKDFMGEVASPLPSKIMMGILELINRLRGNRIDKLVVY